MSRADQIRFEAELRRAERIAANGWEPNDPEPIQQLAVDLAEECWPQQKYWFFNNTLSTDPAATSGLKTGSVSLNTVNNILKDAYKTALFAQLYGGTVPIISRIQHTTFEPKIEVDPKHGRYAKLGYSLKDLIDQHIQDHKQLGDIDDY